MFDTIFSYKKNSYSLTDDERDVIMMFIEFFKYEIPDGNGSYIAMLDLEKIDFIWSPKMALDDAGTFGSWILTFPDQIFIKPSVMSLSFIDRLKTMKLNKKQKEKADQILNMTSPRILNFSQFTDLNIDKELLKFAFYLCEGSGAILSAVFHELYHKWQYNVSKILYVINFFVFLFTGYEFSTKSKFSIEGDVRIYVDNEKLHRTISKFYNMFYSFIYTKNRLATEKDEHMKDILTTQLKEMEASQNRFYEFCEKLLIRLQIKNK